MWQPLSTAPALLGQADPANYGELFQYGALGIVLVLAAFGYIWFKPGVDAILRRAESAEAQRDQLIATYEKEVIPVLVEVQRVLIPAVQDIASIGDKIDGGLATLGDIVRKLEDLQRSMKDGA